jgi:hypothetical protein
MAVKFTPDGQRILSGVSDSLRLGRDDWDDDSSFART